MKTLSDFDIQWQQYVEEAGYIAARINGRSINESTLVGIREQMYMLWKKWSLIEPLLPHIDIWIDKESALLALIVRP